MARTIDQVVLNGVGSINAKWKVIYDDGTMDEFYSVDQESPRSGADDSKLADTDPQLADLLMRYWGQACAEFDPDEDGLRYTKIFGNQDPKPKQSKRSKPTPG